MRGYRGLARAKARAVTAGRVGRRYGRRHLRSHIEETGREAETEKARKRESGRKSKGKYKYISPWKERESEKKREGERRRGEHFPAWALNYTAVHSHPRTNIGNAPLSPCLGQTCALISLFFFSFPSLFRQHNSKKTKKNRQPSVRPLRES